MSGFSGAAERFCIQSTNIFPLILSQKAKCDASCTFSYPAKQKEKRQLQNTQRKTEGVFP